MTSLLAVKDVHFEYGPGIKALAGVNLEVGAGLVGLLGPNGAGKTTLLSLLARRLRPQRGSAVLAGIEVDDPRQRLQWLSRVGFLPQEDAPPVHLTGREVVELALALARPNWSRRRRKAGAEEALAVVRLGDVADRRARGYSGGMRRRLGLARALAPKPTLLLIDEPTSGLDPDERVAFRELLSEIADDAAVFISTHIAADCSVSDVGGLSWYRRLADLGLVAQTEIESSATSEHQARIHLDRLKLRRRLLVLRAPASGVLLDRNLPRLGQWCQTGLEVAKVFDPASLIVEVVVPSTWDSARVGSAVLSLGDGRSVEARVFGLSADADMERGGRILKLRPRSFDGLVVNALVPVRLVVVNRENAVTVPVESVVADNEGGWKVALGPEAGGEGRIRWVPVMPGPSDGERTVIERGIEAGAWVVVGSEIAQLGWGARSFFGIGK